MTVPAAMQEMIVQFFGSGASPRYDKAGDVFLRDPYRSVREALSKRWRVFDFTDLNSDLAFVFVLQDHLSGATVRLSMVGPYAAVFTPSGEVLEDHHVDELLVSEGFQLMSRQILEIPVQIWASEVKGIVYEFLFEFDEGYPWER